MYVIMKNDCQIGIADTLKKAETMMADDKRAAIQRGYSDRGYWIGKLIREGWVDMPCGWKRLETVIERDGKMITYTGGPVRKEVM